MSDNENSRLDLGRMIAEQSLEQGGRYFLRHGDGSPVDTYLNKNYLCDPHLSSSVSSAMWRLIEDLDTPVDAVVAIGVGPTMLATLVGDLWVLPRVIVQEAADPYSTADDGMFVGNVRDGMRVVLLGDTVTTGKTVEWVVGLLRSRGVKVTHVFAVCDREMGGRERIEALGIPFAALYTIDELKTLKVEG